MPVPVAAKVGIAAASVAVAAAIAIYEIPEVRRAAEELRRRIAIALHSLGDNVGPNRREPRFNRPEDAEGFYHPYGVDADEETRRRQREELMYWNMRREEQKRADSQRSRSSTRGSTFDDFLQPDRAGETGTYVFNTGANAWDTDSPNVLRRRLNNAEGVQGLNPSLLANLFGDEHSSSPVEPGELALTCGDVTSDVYNATPRLLSPVHLSPVHSSGQPLTVQPVPVPPASEVLFDFAAHSSSSDARSEHAAALTREAALRQPHPQSQQEMSTSTTTSRSTTVDRELAEDEYMTAGQDDRTRADAYASIQAWAQGEGMGFYSPLLSTPEAPISEPEIISEGQLTPADSASVAESGVDVAKDMASAKGDDYGVMTDTDDGIPTPTSWSEIGSVISESESALRP
ncbi:uncharacterized protein B0T15DRAFT_510299 [Chaetomium strumarium]|uniref:Uncharacterized protein n=1 Tax=Chaetomium strumarium TaxID=1170767 RepID=A0AAJ0GVS4_9PEZI|nr:hypothetical protein B0T15DRAFT_510299 [Chaetomium strumarium]